MLSQKDVIRSPIAGTVYDLPARAESFLHPGDPVASIPGKLNPRSTPSARLRG